MKKTMALFVMLAFVGGSWGISRCPYCEKEGLKSRLYAGMSSTTLMYSPSYYDEDGNFHCDSPNTTTTEYHCSRGHWFTVSWCRGEMTVGPLIHPEQPINIIYDEEKK